MMTDRELFLAMMNFISEGDQIDILKEVLDPYNFTYVPSELEEWVYYTPDDKFFDEVLEVSTRQLIIATDNSGNLYLDDPYIRYDHDDNELMTLSEFQYEELLLENVSKITHELANLADEYLNSIEWLEMVDNYTDRILPEYEAVFKVLWWEYRNVSDQSS